MQNYRQRDFELEGLGSGLRKLGLGLGLVFVIALAVIVGKKMSADAMAVVVGVVCGVVASIPTAILLLVMSARRERQQPQTPAHRRGNYPPVVVIQGGAPQALGPGQPGHWPAPPPGPASDRQFHVVGGEDLLIEDGRY
jgi:hypothetical protein